jgi:hypothetical protein
MWTPGTVYLTTGQRITFKLQNLYRANLLIAAALIASNGTVAFYQKQTVPSLAIVDIVTNFFCNPCLPVLFLANGQFGPSHNRLPFYFDLFVDIPGQPSPITQIPGPQWKGFYDATLTTNSIEFPTNAWSLDGCMSKTPGPVRLVLPFAYFFVTNYGKSAVETQTGCMDTSGQPQLGCEQTTVIEPLNSRFIQFSGPAQLLPFINATPPTLFVTFGVPQVAGFQFFYPEQLKKTPKLAQIVNNFSCDRFAE